MADPVISEVSSQPPARKGSSIARIAVAVVGIVLAAGGYWYWQQRQAAVADQVATEKLRELKVTVVRNPNTNRTQSVNLRLITDAAQFAEAWPYVMQLPDMQALDITGCPITPEQFAQLASNRTITSLQAGTIKLTDADVAHLVGVPITTLHVAQNGLTSACLPQIAQIKTLSVLTLSENPQVAQDLSPLASLPRLEWLLLTGIEVSDAAMEQVAQIKTLQRLSLHGATVSEAAIAKVKAAIPGLAIDL